MTGLRVLDLFSGIGGFSLGLERAGMRTVAFCEIDPFCQKVLKKHWPDVEIFKDVRTLDYEGAVDVICGGYPCQPFSTAGKRKGAADDRHLWPSMFRLIKKHRPSWVIGENVAGHVSMGLDDVLADLESEAYATRAFVIPACAVNAPHRRDRVWFVANASGGRCRESGKGEIQQQGRAQIECSGEDVVRAWHDGQTQKTGEHKRRRQIPSGRCCFADDVCHTSSTGFPHWAGGEVGQPRPVTEFERPGGREVERDFCGVAHGVSRRVDQLRALGNSVVPQIPEMIGKVIVEIEKENTHE